MKLINYFKGNTFGNAMTKWYHYFDIYERHFEKFVDKKVKILEIGVWQAGSTKMWKQYFGKDVTIVGIDILPECKKFEDNQFKVYIGDQSDVNFLREIVEKEGPFDIIMDDGGHYMNQQVTSFNELYYHLNDGGVYLCEDIHTNYWKEFDGGYKKSNTFVELTKNLIDELQAFHSETPELKVTKFTINTTAIHIYDSVIVFEKQQRIKPTSAMIGRVIIKSPLA